MATVHQDAYACRGSRGDTTHLLIRGQRITLLLYRLKTNYQEDRDALSDAGKVTGCVDDEMNSEKYGLLLIYIETVARTKTNIDFLVKLIKNSAFVCGKLA